MWWSGFAVAIVVSILYMLYFIDRGWIPHDEGTLAQSAERVLAGELPHRDFIEGYTGGLSYLHALAFKVFGIHLLALRYTLFVAFIAWVAVFYHAAKRMVSTPGAVAVTLTAVFWSVPNYPAALPSWYNLFLATGGLAALLEYIDSGRRRWLFAAGVLGGLSILMKIHGLLFVAAGVLFILYHESETAADASDNRRSSVLMLLPGAIPLSAVAALLAVGLSRRSWVDVYQFTVPGLAMVAIVCRSVYMAGGRPGTVRAIVRAAVPFAIGVAIPLAAFAAHYASAHALPELVRGVALLPGRAREGASLDPPPPFSLIPTVLAAFVVINFGGHPKRISILQNGLGIAGLALLLVPKTALTFEPLIWSSLAGATPVAVPLLAVFTERREVFRGDSRARSRAALVGCVAAFCSLIQYPFAAPVYFSYSLPLLLLVVGALLKDKTLFRDRALKGLAGVYLVFGALYVAPMPLPGLLGPIGREDTAVLDLPRGGLRISRQDAEDYPLTVELLRAHAPSGVIYAGPDAPEVYFLSGLRNPTPAFFDYLVPDTLFHQHLLQRLDGLGVDAVALRRRVVHSPPLRPEIQEALAKRFPLAREVGNFTIRWRQ